MRINPFDLLFLLIPFSTVQAQTAAKETPPSDEPGYHVVKYSSDNGLPQNSVNDMLFDRNHFLWIATHNGIARFDGQRFRIYNTSNTPAFKSNRFPLLSATADQEVLIKSGYDDSVIYTVTADYGIEKAARYTRWHQKLISYHSNGVFDYDRLVSNVNRKGHDPSETALVNRLYHTGFYWVFTDHEAVIGDTLNYFYVNSETGVIRQLPRNWASAEKTKGFAIGDIFCVARNDGSVSCYREGRPVGIKTDVVVKQLFKGSQGLAPVQFFLYVKGGQSMVRRYNDFYSLRISGNTLTASLLFGGLSFLENQPVYSLLYDSLPKMLLLGTRNAGLWIVTPPLFRDLTFQSKDFSNNERMACLVLSDHRILTNNGILDASAGGKSRLFGNVDKIDWNCFYQSRDGSIWCSKDKQLWRYDASFSRGVVADSLRLESYITGMVEDRTGVLWISTLSSLLKMEKGKLQTVLDRYPSFIDHTIESVAEVSPQKLWIATRNGLYEYDEEKGKINPRPLLPGTYVRAIFKAGDGSIWIGTYGNGYFKYLGGRFCPLPIDPDKYLNETHAFLEDRKGFFWISTNHGLFRMRKADLDRIAAGKGDQPFLYYYDIAYGFETNEFNGGCNPAALKDDAGHFYFPSMNGLVSFSPDSCRPDLPDKLLVVDDLLVDSSHTDYHQSVRVKPGFSRIVAQVSTPYYGAPENLRLEYSFSQDIWYPVNRDGKILINRLPAGGYTLMIRKMNGWGKDNYDTVRIPFQVLPYWYNTLLFWVTLWIVLLWMAVQVRTRILRRQNFRLKLKVDERTFELEKSTLIKENLLSIIMHDLRSPLYAQNLLIENLVMQHKKMDSDKLKYLLSELLQSGQNILQFSSDFLVWYDSQKEDFSVQKKPVLLQPFIENILSFYRQLTTRQGIVLSYDAAPGLLVVTDEHLLAIVIRNIVDNAIKHTESGSIKLTAWESGSRVLIRVKDTGTGMHPDKIKELSGSSADNTSGHSFGYRFIREFGERLGAKLTIESEPDAGTTVTISLAN